MQSVKVFCVSCLAWVLLCSAPSVFAQSETASLSGRVTDPRGGAVPHTTVDAIENDTSVKTTTETNNEGLFYLPSLQPGSYRVVVSKDGFKQIIQANVVLHTQDVLTLNFALEIGSVSETVTVNADQNNINTADATVSTTIDRNFAENLPLNGRSFQSLILLTPGTVMIPVNNNATGGQFSVDGQRASSNSFSVDGVSANLGGALTFGGLLGNFSQYNGANPSLTEFGTTQGLTSVDALQEFKIQTSSYAPEFGRQPGGQVSIQTRSGTNDYHGTGFDYFRNTVLDANNYFNVHGTPPLPTGIDRQNDFGGTLGGPIVKDNTFFFFSYEGLRLLLPTTGDFTVPSLCLRGSGPCLPGESAAADVFQPMLNSFPIPQGPEATNPCTVASNPSCPPSGQLPTGGAPYTLSESFPTTLDSYAIRLDHTFGQRVHLFGRFSDTTSAISSDSGVTTLVKQQVQSWSLTVGADVNISPRLVDEIRVNYAHNVSSSEYSLNLVGGGEAYDTSILFPSPLANDTYVAYWSLRLPGVNGGDEVGAGGKFSQRQANVIDNLSYSVGSHQLKFGGDYRRLFPIFAPLPAVGYSITSDADLAAGNVSVTSLQAISPYYPIYDNFSVFAQDTWRLSSRLTLTYGVRWELNPTPGERNGLYPPNVLGLNNPATASFVQIGQSPLYKTTFNNWAPRVGAAYQIRQSAAHETVLRVGVGIFYDLNSQGFLPQELQANAPQLADVPFPVGANVFTIPPVLTAQTPPYDGIQAVDPNLQLPYTLEWNVSLQQALGTNQSLSASYVASAGYRLLRNDSFANFNPSFGAVSFLHNAANSNYESLQLQFNRRLSHGLQGLASYTYSHSIDDASSISTYNLAIAGLGTSLPNSNTDRGNSDFDLRHALSGALTYNIPSWNANVLSKALLGGWSIDAIQIGQSGLPVDLSGGSLAYGEYYIQDPAGYFGFFLRPNVVPGQPFYLHGAACAAAHGGTPCPGGMGFNPAAFVPVPTDSTGYQPTQEQGTLGRNILRGFPTWQTDFAVHRQFDITERVHLQFRGEVFNLFNHTNFGPNLNPYVGQGSFGVATQTLNNGLSGAGGLSSLYAIGGPRSAQLALKLLF